ncbi:tetratricopeptide repeat protein [Flavobacterium beibuense]|uniref:Uncharacterized protein n=1 Tax=Flavobacterium beibuense TaxID=657326 RepID=A0A444WGY2_9FLAO|nr:hypothetical protein [Flavobacterium beibuense]RYJ45121.1 hypothetical protein NU09_0755 [Flavobacterium beibuense]
MKHLTTLLLMAASMVNAQSLTRNIEKKEAVAKHIEADIKNFQSCLLTDDLDGCIANLIKKGDDAYEKYLIGGALYSIDKDKSFLMHKEAYMQNQSDVDFTLEYAIELHRKGDYNEAIKIYNLYKTAVPQDYRAHVWLSDCYMNIGETEKAIENWKNVNYTKNHVNIDFAISTIYEDTTLLKLRDDYRKKIKQGNTGLLYDLIYLDLNWKIDWWNEIIQEELLEEDIKLLKSTLAETNPDYKAIQAYIEVRKLDSLEDTDGIKTILNNSNLILNNKPLLKNGNMTSNILKICFFRGLLNMSDFYKSRGKELLDIANKNKDIEILNIYAYLQATIDGKVNRETDKLGWTDYNDERFAISYFIGKGEENFYDNPELTKAINDFPDSAKLQWVKLNCAYIEGKPFKEILIDLIKKEFKTLGSDPNHYSYSLNMYFSLLEKES